MVLQQIHLPVMDKCMEGALGCKTVTSPKTNDEDAPIFKAKT